MSVLYTSTKGWLISHENFINSIYNYVEDDMDIKPYKIRSDIFQILQPFKKTNVKLNLKLKHNRKRKLDSNECSDRFNDLKETVNYVNELYRQILIEIHNLLDISTSSIDEQNNKVAVDLAKSIYDESGEAALTNTFGENKDRARRVTVNSYSYVFPANCKFYCKDVVEIERHLFNIKYDLVILDPPWWNKYVRRKRAKTKHGYEMMYNDDLKAIPIENLLTEDGLVVVWCTNSTQHLEELRNSIFPKWRVDFVGKWYWLKITRSGDPICAFSEPPGKQPFEQIMFGGRKVSGKVKPENGKLIVGVPSALHSHKPPLIELLQPFLPENPQCLEIFARYLLPNWTSWGFEAARFQHESLYKVDQN